MNITPVFEEISPERAAEILATRNKKNRNLKERKVEQYTRDMRAGNWKDNGATLSFSPSGMLLDGQHRLTAVVRSGRTIRFLVLHNVPEDAQTTMDTGAARSFADVLKLDRGVTNVNNVAALTRKVHLWELRKPGGNFLSPSFTPSTPELLETFDAHRDSIEHAARVAGRVSGPSNITASVVGLAYWVLRNINEDEADEFFRRLQSGLATSTEDPIYRLLAFARGQGNEGSAGEYKMLAVIFKAWNAWIRGESCGALTFRRGGANPERFPEPVDS